MNTPNKGKPLPRRTFPALGMALLLSGGLVLGAGMAQAQLWGSSSKGSVPNPSSETNQITALSPAHLWIGLKNGDDQGTRFDMKVELLKNGTPVASGLKRCITGVTRNPALATEAVVPFDGFAPVPLASGDVLALRMSTRIGTNPDGTKCGGGHNNATGVRLYYDSTGRPSRFDATIEPNPSEDLYLHSDGGACPGGGGGSLGVTTRFFDPTAPTATNPKCKDSGPVNFNGGNPFAVVGTFQLAGCVTPPTSMTNWWQFEEAVPPFADIRGNPNPATCTSCPASFPGLVNKALVFDGNDFLTVLNDPEVNFPPPSNSCTGFTIDAWILDIQTGGVRTILDKRVNPSAPVGYHLFLFNERLGFQLADGTPPGFVCGNELQFPCTNYVAPPASAIEICDCFHHIAVTVQLRGSDPSSCVDEGKLYVDGAPVLTFLPRTRFRNGVASSTVNTADLYIGERMPAFGSAPFGGFLDELEFFYSANDASGALTDAQIDAIYQAGKFGKCP